MKRIKTFIANHPKLISEAESVFITFVSTFGLSVSVAFGQISFGTLDKAALTSIVVAGIRAGVKAVWFALKPSSQS